MGSVACCTGGSAALVRANAHHDKTVPNACAADATLDPRVALSASRASTTYGRVILRAVVQSPGGAAMLAVAAVA